MILSLVSFAGDRLDINPKVRKPINSLDLGILDEVEWLVPKIKTLGN